jgi:hypothetical protein
LGGGKKIVNFALKQAVMAQRGGGGIAFLFNLGDKWGSVVIDTSWTLYLRNDPVPLYMRLFARVRKTSPPPEFDDVSGKI